MTPEPELQEFRELLKREWPDLSVARQERVVRFFRIVLTENQKQNLTRLVSPKEFLEGHVLDVRALLRSGLITFPAMDLGSGVGVPGLLTAAVNENPWVLAESEGRKAAFLQDVAETLELSNVEVFAGRAEEYLKTRDVSSVVARAVGPIDRIYGWIRGCSTWNNIILLKGPGWDAEWSTFSESKLGKELEVQSEYHYSVGDPPKRLRIVRLERKRSRTGK